MWRAFENDIAAALNAGREDVGGRCQVKPVHHEAGLGL
jgi:hypothetical protein